jgi:predicted nucleic acid-binding protein
MIVVDTNVIAYLYLPGPHTAEAERLFQNDPDWAVPILWRSELRSVVCGYLRRGELTLGQSAALLHEAHDFLAGNEFEVDSLDVLELVSASRCSSYDCEYVALARRLRTKLVTLDKQILRDFPDTAASLAELAGPQ